jgi:hypothetical protein
LEPEVDDWDNLGTIPKEVVKKCALNGFLAMSVGAPWPKEYFGE